MAMTKTLQKTILRNLKVPNDVVVINSSNTNSHAPADNAPYVVLEKPLGSTKHVRIVGIGAGASGINMIRTLRKTLTDYEQVVYEKNAGVGGTWLENRYPGCRCDVPSHNYQFSWRPNPEWSNFFAPAEEINNYLCRICDDEDMMGVIKTQHRVVGAWWDESLGKWDLKVQNLKTGQDLRDNATFIVDASGVLNKWKWPQIPHLQTFQGQLIHSASWPKDFDWTDKSVAVIGNGASGLQLVPAIQPGAKKLVHVVRTPTWILPPRIAIMKMMGGPAKEMLERIELDEHENFTPAQIEKFKTDPVFYREFVKIVEKDSNGLFVLSLNGSPVQALATNKIVEYMTACLGGNEKLCKALIPTFPLGCRRLTPGPGYLESLQAPNAELVTEGVARVLPEGIQLASGRVIKLDAIICATGFDNSYVPRFPIIGRCGNVQDRMRRETPKGYMSCALPGVPNYFTFLGPNGPIGHGSVFTLSEHIAKYIANIIAKCQKEGIKAIAPSAAAVEDYSRHINAFMPRTSWGAPGRSWFKNGEEQGPVIALHPGSRIHFFHMLQSFRGEDWEYVYDGPAQNRFAYLGNGLSTKELDPDVDSTWYLDEESDVNASRAGLPAQQR